VIERFRKHWGHAALPRRFRRQQVRPVFYDAHETRSQRRDAEQTHRLIEEAQVFLEACHACYARMLQQPAMVAV
jgi:hypothetical protein